MPKCADCGRDLVIHRGRWAHVGKSGKTWGYVCRMVHSNDDDQPRILSADYHYIEGEVQKHWPPTIDPFHAGPGEQQPTTDERTTHADSAMEPTDPT